MEKYNIYVFTFLSSIYSIYGFHQLLTSNDV